MAIRQWISARVSPQMTGATSTRQLWAEALGFFILCCGFFIGLSIVAYDPSDLVKILTGDGIVTNLGGPLGARLSHYLMISIGIVSYLWPVALLIWGALLAFGVISKPRKRRFIAFFILSAMFAALAEVLNFGFQVPFGQGGAIGELLGKSLMGQVGYGGALVFLFFAVLATLILTRNMSFSQVNLFRSEADIVGFPVKSTRNKGGKSDPSSIMSVDPEQSGPLKKARKSKKDQDSDQEIVAETETSDLEMDLGPLASAPAKPDTKMFKSKSIVMTQAGDESEVTELLTSKLAEFKVEGTVTEITQGPVVTTYEYEPAAGTKVAKIESLQSDLARLLKAKSLRVVPVPGKSTVGFEVPSEDRKIIHFGNLVNSTRFKSRDLALPIAMGSDTFGQPVIEDLAEMPHLLVAGSTGSGKSVFINTLITSLLVRNTAKELRLILIDPKMVELGAYNGVAHMACPVVTDVESDGQNVLNRLVAEMELRYQNLKAVGAKNITAFNQTIKSQKKGKYRNFKGKWQTMPYVVVIVDEFADLVMSLGKEAEQSIARLAQKARAAGIHLVIATQRPSVQVVTGLIKANFPTRVGFRVTSGVDSRTILDQGGAEQLLGKGDLLYMSPHGMVRLHSGFLDENEISKVAKSCRGKK